MPVNEGPSTITVGSICYSCMHMAAGTCPYGNHQRNSALYFKGDIRGKCSEYTPILEAESKNKMKKNAKNMKDSQLNIEIYRKIMALNDQDAKKIVDYWDKLFPHEYSVQMATDEVETGPKGPQEKGPHGKGKGKGECKKEKNKDKHKDKDIKNWYKDTKTKAKEDGKRKNVFPEDFKNNTGE